MPFPPPDEHVPSMSLDEVNEVDRMMVEGFGIDLARMAENGGRGLAVVARERFLGGAAAGKRVFVLAGPGATGGAALVAARRLHSWGARVTVSLSAEIASYRGLAGEQLRTLFQLGVLETDQPHGDAHLIIDGLIGVHLNGPPRGRTAELIHAANNHPARIISLDGPTGLDLGSGEVHDPCIKAAATCTLALPKDGLFARDATDVVGELYLADIGVPPQLYTCEPLQIEVGALFSRSDVLRLR